jgi:hypothetical protein
MSSRTKDWRRDGPRRPNAPRRGILAWTKKRAIAQPLTFSLRLGAELEQKNNQHKTLKYES